MTPATAYAHTNIALVKYWGKRKGAIAGLNLPATGSLSLTLDRFGTETRIEPADADDFVLGSQPVSPGEAAKVFAFLDRVRALAGSTARVRVTSRNDVPTAAGLASSASAFAALAVAATRAFGVSLDERALSQLARQGSGSAARSIFGGFVLLHRGARDDGADCFAEPLPSTLPVNLVVVRCGEGKKDTGSTDGMDHTAATSPYFRAWVDTHAADLDEARRALAGGDLPRLGEVMEHSTLKMHATTLAARPGFFYFQPTTIAVLQAVRALRAAGTPCWATMDAGPHVKVLCAPAVAGAVAAALQAIGGVRGVEVAAPGPAARVLA
ncbi:MAG: diphosphomevalonate decarboxylase [Deltaproteobacteria bacterium]|nr:diphosphomevalonate decarboxylase [Deltaproteobacteria bacterium]